MFPIEAFEATIAKAVAVFRDLGIAFHLTGGITSIAYGEPRLTQDIDVVLDPMPLQATPREFVEALAAAGFLIDLEASIGSIASGQLFQVLDVDEGLKLDLYPRQLIPGELSRSEEHEIFAGVRYPIVSLPDAVLSKLLWIQKGSHKSRQDVRRVMAHATREQRERVQEIATQMQLSSLLHEVLAEPNELE